MVKYLNIGKNIGKPIYRSISSLNGKTKLYYKLYLTKIKALTQERKNDKLKQNETNSN